MDSDSEPEETHFENIQIGSEEIEENISLSRHLFCAAHTLNLLATTDFNKSVKKNFPLHFFILKKCNFVWKAVKWAKANEEMHLILGSSLKRPTVTRWNSLFDSIFCLVKHELNLNSLVTQICVIKKKDNLEDYIFTSEDINYLKELLLVMKPISVSLDKLQGNVLYGELLPAVLQLKKNLEELQESNLKYLKEVLPDLVRGLKKRFFKILDFKLSESKTAILATCFNPKYKLHWLKDFDEKQVEEIHQNCLEKIKELTLEIAKEDQEKTEETHANSDSEEFISPPAKRRCVNDDQLQNELDLYFYQEDDTKKILQEHKNVKKLFIKYNSNLCSSASVERLFSIGKCILTPQRCQLSDKNFERLLFLRSNKQLKK